MTDNTMEYMTVSMCGADALDWCGGYNAAVTKANEIIYCQQQEIRQLQLKLDDCERDIIPKLKYSLERANKYGAETEAENIRLLKENEKLQGEIKEKTETIVF